MGLRTRRRQQVSGLGFRRIFAVWVDTGGPIPRFTVEGVVHRQPRSVAVSAGMAAGLIARGVPLLTCQDREEPSC